MSDEGQTTSTIAKNINSQRSMVKDVFYLILTTWFTSKNGTPVIRRLDRTGNLLNLSISFQVSKLDWLMFRQVRAENSVNEASSGNALILQSIMVIETRFGNAWPSFEKSCQSDIWQSFMYSRASVGWQKPGGNLTLVYQFKLKCNSRRLKSTKSLLI